MKKKNKNEKFSLILSLIITFVITYLILNSSNITFAIFLKKVLLPLIRMVVVIIIGLIIGEVIEATGWTKYLAVIARPLFKFANLDERCGAAFTIAFFSGVSANAMLYNFYKDGKIDKKEVILCNIMNHFPAFFLHLPSTLFIVLPLTKMVGATYLLLVFTGIILRISVAAIYGHFALKPKMVELDLILDEKLEEQFSKSSMLSRILKRVPKRILNILKFVFPIFLGVYYLKIIGAFDGLRNLLTNTFIGSVIPVESLSIVVISFIADYTSGFVTAGALLSHNVLTFKQGVLAILFGNIIAIPMRALRHQLPRFLGIFSPGLGAQVLFVGQLTRALSLILVGILYYAIF